VTPKRRDDGDRLYDEDDVARLRLLKRVTDEGYPIGRVANLAPGELLALLGGEAAPRSYPAAFDPDGSLRECLDAIEAMDSTRVRAVLTRGLAALGVERFLDGMVIPMLGRVGELWTDDRICPAHEHLFSAAVQHVLGSVLEQVGSRASGPVIVVTTPSGQRHELGALIAGVVAAYEGWRVAYLGPDLVAEDIARAVATADASAVALSVVLDSDANPLLDQIRALRRETPDEVRIFIGGRASEEHWSGLTRVGGTWLPDLASLRTELRVLAEANDGGMA
jgi:methanogenic corrinoid protein MtbC1